MKNRQNHLFFQHSSLNESFKDLNKWGKESEGHLDYCHRMYDLVYLGYQIRDFLSKFSVVENVAVELNQKCLGSYELMGVLEGCKSGLKNLFPAVITS